MPMTYQTLLGTKGTPGSIANWVGYSKIDFPTVLHEAQTIIFQSLRIREMRTEFVFGMTEGSSKIALPDRFLDPIGRITDEIGQSYAHKDEGTIKDRRTFVDADGGTLGENAFTTGSAGSSNVTVDIPGHGLTQGSDITFPPSAPIIDGIGMAGAFPVDAVVDENTIVVTSPAGDQADIGNVNGGVAGLTWTGNLLVAATPVFWSIYDDTIQFDYAFQDARTCRLLYFRRPHLLSDKNPTNFLTKRYPRIIREATNAAAASYMKDDNEEQKALQKLGQLIDATNAESDLSYRGADLSTQTPGSVGAYY